MLVLQPKLAVLDETDSGLDIDALKTVAEGVNAMRAPDRAIVVVTHYQRLLNYIVPDFVHVLTDGRIARSGGKELALELEDKGYGWIDEPEAARGGGAGVGDGTCPGTACGVDGGRRTVHARVRGASDRGIQQRPSWLRQLRRARDGDVRGAGAADHARRRVAIHARDADCRHGIRAW